MACHMKINQSNLRKQRKCYLNYHTKGNNNEYRPPRYSQKAIYLDIIFCLRIEAVLEAEVVNMYITTIKEHNNSSRMPRALP